MRLILSLALSLVAGSALAHQECRYSAERNLSIDPAGLRALALTLHSSDLHANGVASGGKIEVHGKACASEESMLADLDLTQTRSGDRVVVEPKHRDREWTFNLTGSHYAYIDIDVRLPANLPLEIATGSGDAKVADVAAVTFDTGSGDMIVERVAGAVKVKLGSGDITADDVGSLQIERGGSGDVRAKNVRGEITVGHVGSGDLTFRDVKGGVHVDAIGSGDLVVDTAGGDVDIGSIGSGDVNVDHVGGNFTVRHAGSGDLHHRHVTGKVDVPRRHQDD